MSTWLCRVVHIESYHTKCFSSGWSCCSCPWCCSLILLLFLLFLVARDLVLCFVLAVLVFVFFLVLVTVLFWFCGSFDLAVSVVFGCSCYSVLFWFCGSFDLAVFVVLVALVLVTLSAFLVLWLF